MPHGAWFKRTGWVASTNFWGSHRGGEAWKRQERGCIHSRIELGKTVERMYLAAYFVDLEFHSISSFG